MARRACNSCFESTRPPAFEAGGLWVNPRCDPDGPLAGRPVTHLAMTQPTSRPMYEDDPTTAPEPKFCCVRSGVGQSESSSQNRPSWASRRFHFAGMWFLTKFTARPPEARVGESFPNCSADFSRAFRIRFMRTPEPIRHRPPWRRQEL
jgi:hypothetical protein